MRVVSKIDEVRSIIEDAKKNNLLIGFVPTMGFLHKGHLSLVAESKKHTQFQVMSIFVNKIQFNNMNDYNTYPRDLENDFDLAEKNGVDLIFLPDDDEMYGNHLTTVHLDRLTDNLCGACRPGHFDGVFTVVSKLFNIIQPHVAVFGQKDIQQAVSIQKMVYDLNFPVKIIMGPIIREDSGLAMSSRNKHLSREKREDALVIYKGLKRAEQLLLNGERDSKIIINEIEKIILKGRPDKIDYISAVRFSDLSFLDTIGEKAVIAVAAFFGDTRLIDNMVIEYERGRIKCVF